MKKMIVALLITSFLMTFLTSCQTEMRDESKDNTENTLTDNISNEEKYKPVLNIYKDVITNLDEKINSKGSSYSKETKEYEWESAIIGAAASYHLSTNVPGYAFCDLNKNGNDEMLLLLDDYTVLAIFSYADGEPLLLDNYLDRKKCTIEADGNIQVYGSSGSDRSSFSIYKIAKDDKELVLLEEYGTDGHDPDTLDTYYYKILNGTKTSITELEYIAARSQGIYPHIEFLTEHTRENTNFEFIPLVPEISYKRIFEMILNYDSKITSAGKYLWGLYFPFGTNSIGSLESVEICYLDMDGDGIEELLLRSGMGDHLMLRYQGGTVYLYEYSYKEIDRVYEDGSYGHHSQIYLEHASAVCYGISRITFDENEKKKNYPVYTIYDGENESYFTINGKLASKSELDALLESRKNIKEVTWTTYRLDIDKIPSVG